LLWPAKRPSSARAPSFLTSNPCACHPPAVGPPARSLHRVHAPARPHRTPFVRPPARPLFLPLPPPLPTSQADLTDLTSLPATLVGVSAIIDCATARPEESTQKVDWEGKVALIQCAQAMGIQRYVFFSIFNCDKHPEVPLMNIKACTEDFLASSGLNYTTLRLCGFMQVGWP
jgi:uncharacterized protein YbjT (DUF2867 family)